MEKDSNSHSQNRTALRLSTQRPRVYVIDQRSFEKCRSVDRLLAFLQVVSLMFLIIYVAKTADIAASTSSAAESAAKSLESGTKTTKAQIAVTLVDQLYADPKVQEILERIYNDDLVFKNNHGDPVITARHGKDNLEEKVDLTLNRFQILGHLYDLKVLNRKDLRGLRFEVIAIGRNQAIRDYLAFLNHDYQALSCVTHYHFENFNDLYIAFEYMDSLKEPFEKRNFQYPAEITKDLEEP